MFGVSVDCPSIVVLVMQITVVTCSAASSLHCPSVLDSFDGGVILRVPRCGPQRGMGNLIVLRDRFSLLS